MAIKLDPKTKRYTVQISGRHPITRVPSNLRRKGIKTEAEAKRVERELIIKLDEKLKQTICPLWQVVAEEFLESYESRGISKTTYHAYKYHLQTYTYDSWQDRSVDSITGGEIRQLILTQAGNRSTGHQKNVKKCINAVFSYSVERGYINRNPVPFLKFKIADSIKKVLTEPQVELFLNKAKEMAVEWYPHWCVAIYTGLRNGELYALTWDRVDLDKRQMLINCAWNNKDGFKSTKSGDDRIIEIAPTLIPMLKAMKLQGSDYPFVLPRIDKWDKGEQARELRMFLLGLGLPQIRFHDLRATWATIMLSKGIVPIKVMKMGGWKDLKTMQIYVRKAGVDIKGITDGLELHNASSQSGTVLSLIPCNK
ncbi:MAG: site-specific integrase [Oligoflexia bacterium]|nr:site-specific integrase [Oligoflexia bacterium]